MNEPPPFLPELPPQPEAFIRPTLPPPRPPVSCPPKPLGANPEEQVPIIGLVSAMEALLRQPRRVMFQLRQPGAGGLILNMIGIGLVCCLVYGFVAGTFSGGPQLWAAPVKIAGGLLFAGLICLPSLYIFTCLGGAQARLAEVTGLVAGLVALPPCCWSDLRRWPWFSHNRRNPCPPWARCISFSAWWRLVLVCVS